jgi:hypothetical protein
MLFHNGLFVLSVERRRRLTMAAVSPPPRPQFTDDDTDDTDDNGEQQGVAAGAALGGHWRRWSRAFLGRSSSAPSAQDLPIPSTAGQQQKQLSLTHLTAKFPHLHDILQVNPLFFLV